MGGQGELRGWVEDDFVDEVSSQPLVENDPWDPNVPPSAPGLSLPGRLGSESEANTAHQADLDSASDFVDELADIDPGDQWSDGAFDPATAWAEPEPTIDAYAAGDESRRGGGDEAHARDGDAGLSKLNWNNTQFDGGETITVTAARQVGDILKGVPRFGRASAKGFASTYKGG